MLDDRYEEKYELPPRRPRKRGQTFSNNQYGMATDGSKIDYSNGWKFQTSPYELADDRRVNQIIGVHKDGAPIYAKYVDDADDIPELDQDGGRYTKTDEFPNGIYHYVITLNINNS
jgi:hypothetical protein